MKGGSKKNGLRRLVSGGRGAGKGQMSMYTGKTGAAVVGKTTASGRTNSPSGSLAGVSPGKKPGSGQNGNSLV